MMPEPSTASEPEGWDPEEEDHSPCPQDHGSLLTHCLAGNLTLTIPHMFGKRKEAGFPFGCADAAALDGRRGSNIYEVNPWLWQFGRGKPRLGGLSIEQTGERKDAASDAQHKRAAETKQARKTA